MGDETVVVMMTVLKRAYAISVKRELLPILWVQLKAVYSTSRLRALIRGRKQKLIIFIHTKAIDQFKHCK